MTLLFALFSAGARADWKEIAPANTIFAAYADQASIRRNGDVVTMHGLYDFVRQDFTPEGRGLYSTAVLREYDCAGRRVRLMSAIDFSGHMGEGTAVSTTSMPRRWETIVAGGVDDAFWQIACSAK